MYIYKHASVKASGARENYRVKQIRDVSVHLHLVYHQQYLKSDTDCWYPVIRWNQPICIDFLKRIYLHLFIIYTYNYIHNVIMLIYIYIYNSKAIFKWIKVKREKWLNDTIYSLHSNYYCILNSYFKLGKNFNFQHLLNIKINRIWILVV